MDELLMKALLWALGLLVTLVNSWMLFALRGLKAEDKALHKRIESEREKRDALKDHVEGTFAKQRDMDALEKRISDDLKDIKGLLRTLVERQVKE